MNSRERLHHLIPGGAHTYSRGDDQYPGNAPPLLLRGNGPYVWDEAGNRFLDYGMALRAVTVGYGYEPIAQAAYEEILKGNNLTRASLTELKAAEVITDLIPSAEMVKFAKNGSTVTTAAIKLSRAYTGRNYVLIPEEHPFFSYDDWFIGTTPLVKGIPDELRSLTLRFRYNDIQSLERIFSEHEGQIACVIMEPATHVGPCPVECDISSANCRACPRKSQHFLRHVREICTREGTLLILDEMITGFRWHVKGAQYFYDVKPDLATFGKGMANGFSVAALVGRREVMELGGIQKEGAERVFLISTTHGAEMSGLGAFIKTVEVYRELNVIEHIWDYGRSLISEFNVIACQLGISDYCFLGGYPCSPIYIANDRGGVPSMAFRTLFAQEMIKGGVLMPWIAISHSHGEAELAMTLSAARKALQVYAKALEQGVEKYLVGVPMKPVFRQYN